MPCNGGSFGNGTGLTQSSNCEAVQVGYWAPVGTALPIECPLSGFYCPGAEADSQFAGARPILVPVGERTVTEKVEVLQKEMTLEVSLEEYNETAMRHELAALYNVPVELITLAVSAGSLQLTLTIATSASGASTSNNVPSIADIMATVAAIDDSALGAALGTNLSSTAPAEATVSVISKSICPKGYW